MNPSAKPAQIVSEFATRLPEAAPMQHPVTQDFAHRLATLWPHSWTQEQVAESLEKLNVAALADVVRCAEGNADKLEESR